MEGSRGHGALWGEVERDEACVVEGGGREGGWGCVSAQEGRATWG